MFPEPQPGLVIRYAYLWRREFLAGRDEGVKDRPCALVAALLEDDGHRRVIVLPITHSPPDDPSAAVEIPAATKARLGLDGVRSWVILDEGNEFIWPGPDLRPVPGRDPRGVAYGFLPPALFRTIRDRFLALSRARRIPRD